MVKPCYRNVIPTFESGDKVLRFDHSNESYCEQSFSVVLFIMLYKVVLTFESVGGILKYDHSNKQHFPVELFIKL